MKYTQSKFSVGSPSTQSYADNWERTFGSKKLESICPHPARNGHHESYIKSNGDEYCRACGEGMKPTAKKKQISEAQLARNLRTCEVYPLEK